MRLSFFNSFYDITTHIEKRHGHSLNSTLIEKFKDTYRVFFGNLPYTSMKLLKQGLPIRTFTSDETKCFHVGLIDYLTLGILAFLSRTFHFVAVAVHSLRKILRVPLTLFALILFCVFSCVRLALSIALTIACSPLIVAAHLVTCLQYNRLMHRVRNLRGQCIYATDDTNANVPGNTTTLNEIFDRATLSFNLSEDDNAYKPVFNFSLENKLICFCVTPSPENYSGLLAAITLNVGNVAYDNRLNFDKTSWLEVIQEQPALYQPQQ